MEKQHFGKLVVFGVGLIGGSCALALKEKHAVREVVGIDRTRANLDEAQKRGLIDRAFVFDDVWEDELRDADIVLLATPVAQIDDLLARILPVVSEKAIISDAGSTKQNIIRIARARYRLLPRVSLARFVPAHPIAGTEHSGAAAAFASLYENKNIIITPLDETAPECIAAINALWQTCGATIHTMSPVQHDTIFAAVSHLPHMLAFALVAELASRPDAATFFQYAGSGFRDFTRIAASSPEMWRDIAFDNRDALIQELDAFARMLLELRTEIVEQNDTELMKRLQTASDARRRWIQGGGSG